MQADMPVSRAINAAYCQCAAKAQRLELTARTFERLLDELRSFVTLRGPLETYYGCPIGVGSDDCWKWRREHGRLEVVPWARQPIEVPEGLRRAS